MFSLRKLNAPCEQIISDMPIQIYFVLFSVLHVAYSTNARFYLVHD